MICFQDSRRFKSALPLLSYFSSTFSPSFLLPLYLHFSSSSFFFSSAPLFSLSLSSFCSSPLLFSVSLSSPRSLSRDGNLVARRGKRKSLPFLFSLFLSPLRSSCSPSFLSLFLSPLRSSLLSQLSLSCVFLPSRLLATEIASVARRTLSSPFLFLSRDGKSPSRDFVLPLCLCLFLFRPSFSL